MFDIILLLYTKNTTAVKLKYAIHLYTAQILTDACIGNSYWKTIYRYHVTSA